MVAPSMVILDEGDARVEAVKGALVPQVLQGAKPGLSIESAVSARGITARFNAIKDVLTPSARMRLRMPFGIADYAPVTGHFRLTPQTTESSLPPTAPGAEGNLTWSAKPVWPSLR